MLSEVGRKADAHVLARQPLPGRGGPLSGDPARRRDGARHTAAAAAAGRAVLGYHQPAGADRLDLLAFRYLGDATAFWRICDANNAMVPATLMARALIAIPDAGA